jgi:ABC-type multidrug transport system fused ATPase/permease subunit
MRYFLRVLRFVRPYWRSAALSVLITVATALVALLGPWPMKILFDSVLGTQPLPEILEGPLGGIAGRTVALVIVVVLAGFGFTLLENGLSVLNSFLQTRLEQGVILDFRSALFQHAQRLSLAFHDQNKAGSLIYAINFQADSAAGLIMAAQPLAQAGLTLVGMFWITYRIDPQLALLSLTVVPILYYAVGYYITHIQQRLREVRNMEGDSLSIIHEAISMLRVIVAFGRERHEYGKFRAQGEQAVDARVRLTVRQTAFSLVVNSTTAAGTALVLGFGIAKILQGSMTAGELLVVLAYIASIYQPLEAISNTIGSLQDRFVSLELAFQLLDTEPQIRNAPGAAAIGRSNGRIVFEDVDFAYEGRAGTLRGVSFEAGAGEIIGIVGPTGAGKSTLVSLIPRFYDPARGRVLVDGRDIRTLTLESLRAQVSMVLQEPLLFSGTIADNIRYARLEARSDEIVAAAQAANAHEFIMRLPRQYETELGEKGVRLSGGERQRISVARAFLKDSPILILDEPTSAIDSKTEAVILDALDRLMAGRTTFMIAHRLSTIRNPSRILVLDRGRIVEQGTVEQLLRANGLFRELWTVQSGGAGSLRPAAGHEARVQAGTGT